MSSRRFFSPVFLLVLMLPMASPAQNDDLERVLQGAIGVIQGIQNQNQQQRQQEVQREQQQRQQETSREAQQRQQELRRRQQQTQQELQRQQQQQQQQPGQEQYSPQQPQAQQHSQPSQDAEAQARRQAQRERAALVQRIQQRLTDLGYEPGPVDGVMGARTRDSIMTFQHDLGMLADGEADAGLLATLEDIRESPRTAPPPPAPVADNQRQTAEPVTATPAPPPVVIRGIQQNLRALGYEPGPADGVMGAHTRNSIRAFQRDHGLPADGEPDLDLLAQLRALQPPASAPSVPVVAEETSDEETTSGETEQAADTHLDILGIRPGMDMTEAEILIRQHLGENLAVFTAPELQRRGSSRILRVRLHSGKLFLDLDTDELIGIYDYPEGASNEVVAMFRELYFPASSAPPRQAVVQALREKYGEQDQGEDPLRLRRNLLSWYTTAADRACGVNAVVSNRATWLSASEERVDSWQSHVDGDTRQWRLPSLGDITRDCGTGVVARLNVERSTEDDDGQIRKLSVRLYDSTRVLELAREAREQAAQVAEQATPELKL